MERVANETTRVPELTLVKSSAKKIFADIPIEISLLVSNLIIILTRRAKPNNASAPRPFIKNSKSTIKTLINNDAVFPRIFLICSIFKESKIRNAEKNPNSRTMKEKEKLLSIPKFSEKLITGYISA